MVSDVERPNNSFLKMVSIFIYIYIYILYILYIHIYIYIHYICSIPINHYYINQIACLGEAII